MLRPCADGRQARSARAARRRSGPAAPAAEQAQAAEGEQGEAGRLGHEPDRPQLEAVEPVLARADEAEGGVAVGVGGEREGRVGRRGVLEAVGHGRDRVGSAAEEDVEGAARVVVLVVVGRDLVDALGESVEDEPHQD